MKCLLDTHTLLWWLNGDEHLSSTAKALITDRRNIIHVSAVSAWEIATKYEKGKLPTAAQLLLDFIIGDQRSRLPRPVDHQRTHGNEQAPSSCAQGSVRPHSRGPGYHGKHDVDFDRPEDGIIGRASPLVARAP